jgi:hypothetical protein
VLQMSSDKFTKKKKRHESGGPLSDYDGLPRMQTRRPEVLALLSSSRPSVVGLCPLMAPGEGAGRLQKAVSSPGSRMLSLPRHALKTCRSSQSRFLPFRQFPLVVTNHFTLNGGPTPNLLPLACRVSHTAPEMTSDDDYYFVLSHSDPCWGPYYIQIENVRPPRRC